MANFDIMEAWDVMNDSSDKCSDVYFNELMKYVFTIASSLIIVISNTFIQVLIFSMVGFLKLSDRNEDLKIKIKTNFIA